MVGTCGCHTGSRICISRQFRIPHFGRGHLRDRTLLLSSKDVKGEPWHLLAILPLEHPFDLLEPSFMETWSRISI